MPKTNQKHILLAAQQKYAPKNAKASWKDK
jgi:hypothetical protein